jgi:hypothetical protein
MEATSLKRREKKLGNKVRRTEWMSLPLINLCETGHAKILVLVTGKGCPLDLPGQKDTNKPGCTVEHCTKMYLI